MNTIRYGCLLLILALLSACATHTRTLLLPPHQAAPQNVLLVAQFGARLNISGQSVPVQGEVQMRESGGSLALILPHGRTLGICTYSADVVTAAESKGAKDQQSVKMECTPAEGMGREAASLLVRTGVAIYRILPALDQSPALARLGGSGWSAHLSPTAEGLTGVYNEQDGMTMDMYFVEISHL